MSESQMVQRFHALRDHIMRELGPSLIQLVYLSADRVKRRNTGTIRDRNPLPRVKTGFLIEVDNEWLICTAGHVIVDMASESTGSRKLVAIDATAALHAGGPQNVRLDLKYAKFLHALDPATGVDLGAIRFSLGDRMRLAKTGARPMGPRVWASGHDEAHLFVVFGFPSSSRTERLTVEPKRLGLCLEQRYPLLPVEAIRDPQRERGQVARFRGRLLSRAGTLDGKSEVLMCTNGMSGSPIIALHFTAESFKYKLVAVQTFEVEEEAIIGGCFIRHLVKLLHDQAVTD